MASDPTVFAAEPQRVLVVLPTWVGDFVMATPTLRAVRERFEHAEITFLHDPNLRDLIRGGDWMDECVEDAARASGSAATLISKRFRRLVRTLRERRFDLAIVLPNSFRSSLIARLSGAKRRVGYDRDGRGFLLTDRIPCKNRRRKRNRNALRTATDSRSRGAVVVGTNLPVRPGRFVPMPLVEYYADLAEFIGCHRPGHRLELFTTLDCDEAVEERLTALGVAGRRPLVVISPGARYGAAKCWFPERFAAVADRLAAEEGAVVAATCGPGEEPIARTIGAKMRCEGFVFDNPRLSLGELKSLVRRCDLLLCNDAGPRHFAKAFNVPVVTIFGPTHPDWTATDYPAERIVRINIECGPCQQRTCPLGHLECMAGVTVDAVHEAAVELLRSRMGQGVR